MPKTVTIRARSKETLDAPDLSVTAKFPTIQEAIANPTVAAAFEHAAHATFAINLQSKLRANATLEDTAKRLAPQAIADAIDYSTMGTRQRVGLSATKLKEIFFAAAQSGDVALMTNIVQLNKAGNLVELEKIARAKFPAVFVKAPAKVEAPKAAAPVVKK